MLTLILGLMACAPTCEDVDGAICEDELAELLEGDDPWGEADTAAPLVEWIECTADEMVSLEPTESWAEVDAYICVRDIGSEGWPNPCTSTTVRRDGPDYIEAACDVRGGFETSLMVVWW